MTSQSVSGGGPPGGDYYYNAPPSAYYQQPGGYGQQQVPGGYGRPGGATSQVGLYPQVGTSRPAVADPYYAARMNIGGTAVSAVVPMGISD